MNHKLQACLRLGFCGATFGALLLPLVLTTFSPHTDSNTENRSKTAFPSIHTDAGTLNTDYTAQLDAWFSDCFGLRPKLVTAYGTLTRKIFATSAENDVIAGKDGWLYYTPTADDITGVATITETDARHLARTVEIMHEYAEKNDSNLIFTVAPNKGSIYSEYLPARYIRTGEKNNLDLFTEQIAQTNVPYCDLRQTLRNHAATTQIYHKLDTHWNGAGAMLGFAALRTTLGRDDCGFLSANTSYTHDFEGDLWKMLSPSVAKPDDNIVYDIPQSYTYIGRFRSTDDLKIQTVCADAEHSLLMYRDSFGRALIPILSQGYGECTYLRGDRVMLDIIESTHFDDIIIEIVERNLPQLLSYAPQLPAPEVSPQLLTEQLQIVADSRTHQIVQPQIFAARTDKYIHIYGQYHAVCADCDRIFCEIDGRCFEAFPCCETALLGDIPYESNGFSLFVPVDAVGVQSTVRILAEHGTVHFDLGTNQLSIQQ